MDDGNTNRMSYLNGQDSWSGQQECNWPWLRHHDNVDRGSKATSLFAPKGCSQRRLGPIWSTNLVLSPIEVFEGRELIPKNCSNVIVSFSFKDENPIVPRPGNSSSCGGYQDHGHDS